VLQYNSCYFSQGHGAANYQFASSAINNNITAAITTQKSAKKAKINTKNEI